MRPTRPLQQILIALTLVLGAGPPTIAGTSANAPADPTGISPYPSGITEAALITELLDAHNRYRRAVGVPPLHWSETLADGARAWAGLLARENRFEHSTHGRNQPVYGENLASSTGELTPAGLVTLWGDEQQEYIPGARFPNVAKNGDWATVGHYTQVVWRDTQEVGCGVVRGRESTVLVCRYSPAGNWIGQLAY